MIPISGCFVHAPLQVFTSALYNLAANPQFIQPLREEVEAIVEREGWSRTSLSKMRKVDSFLKETVRMEGIEICQSFPPFTVGITLSTYFYFRSLVGLMRKATNDFTFSDGTFIPKGTRIHVGLTALHHDNALYENPEAFDPFRFANMGEEGQGAKHQFAATSPEYLSFGHGRHAWYVCLVDYYPCLY